MLRIVTLSIFLALLGSSSAFAQVVVSKPEDVGLSSKGLNLIHEGLKLHIDEGQVAGGIVLVARNGKVVYLEAQGAPNTFQSSGRLDKFES